MTKFRYFGDHPDHIQVGDKSIPVSPGDFVDLSDDDVKDPDNSWRIDDGALVRLSDLEGKPNPGTGPIPVPSTATQGDS